MNTAKSDRTARRKHLFRLCETNAWTFRRELGRWLGGCMS